MSDTNRKPDVNQLFKLATDSEGVLNCLTLNQSILNLSSFPTCRMPVTANCFNLKTGYYTWWYWRFGLSCAQVLRQLKLVMSRRLLWKGMGNMFKEVCMGKFQKSVLCTILHTHVFWRFWIGWIAFFLHIFLGSNCIADTTYKHHNHETETSLQGGNINSRLIFRKTI